MDSTDPEAKSSCLSVRLYQYSTMSKDHMAYTAPLTLNLISFQRSVDISLTEKGEKVDIVPKNPYDIKTLRFLGLEGYIDFQGPILELVYLLHSSSNTNEKTETTLFKD